MSATAGRGTSRTEERTRLSPAEITAVTGLVSAAESVDGVGPLSEHVLLHLAHGGDPRAVNLLVYDAVDLVAYAHLDPTDVPAGPSAELVVDPEHRHRGLGRSLVTELLQRSDGRLRLWAHGKSDGAAALAASVGMHRSRALWQLRRSLKTDLPEVVWPAGISVRTFLPGLDEQAWLALNSKAFAHHREQGTWTAEDLDLREHEPWFDPSGFFLAEQSGQLVGFHWTKVHGGHEHPAAGHVRPEPLEAGHPGADPQSAEHQHAEKEHHDHDPIGEVYVVGVDPDAESHGLGRALTLQGLHYLRGLGLDHVLLYVDEDNPRAYALYERLGFTRWDSDVTYEISPATPGSPARQ